MYEQPNPFFMCIRDGHIKKFRGTLGVHSATLTKANREGYGIYFCAAEMGKAASKTKDNVEQTTVLWADMDNGHAECPVKPNIIVQTSPDKYQYYWRLSRPITNGKKIEEMLARIIAVTGADPACKDSCRLMRVPGFANQKNGFDVVELEDDGKDYLLAQLEAAFPALAVAEVKEVAKTSSFDLSKCVSNILTGEVIHESRASMSMYLANTGMRMEPCVELIETLLDTGYQLGNIEVSRYQERKGNNGQVVKSAYGKIFGEVPTYDFAEQEEGELYTKLPALPDGGMKTLVDDIMGNMFHPVYEVAVPLAMHLVGMFGSGGYHLGGVTGTKRRVVCMQSGAGKDVVTSYISACIRELADARAENFKGANSFTPRTVHAELRHFRCRSYIVSEAGIAGQSETGDVASMRAYMLQALAAKADRPLSIRATVADIKAAKEENLTLDVHGTVVNVIAESTIETYAKMMQMSHADVTGMMGREELIFPKPNFDHRIGNMNGFTGVSDAAMDILQPLAQRFLDHPATSGVAHDPKKTFKAVDTSKVEDKLIHDYERCCALKQKHIESAQAISTQYSRLHEKVKCTALILAIADSPYDDPVVLPEHIDWARHYHQAIIATVTAHLGGKGSLASPIDGCIAFLEEKISAYPIRYKDKLHTVHESKRIVAKGWFSATLDPESCAPFKTLVNTMYYGKNMDARKAMLTEALDRGLLVKTTYDKKEAYILPKRG